MDSFELNKIIGAILGTLLFVMGVGFIAEAVYHPIEGSGPGYELPEPEGEAEAGPAEEEPLIPIGTLLASANAEQGARAMSRCTGCHNVEEGAPNKQGPGLYDVVGRVIGGHEGFAYSQDLASMGEGGETWTYEHLNDFLLAPRDFAPGTKMNFAGLRNAEERANVIAYLASLSADPVPFPAPEEAGADAADDDAAAATEDAPAVEADSQAVDTPTETQTETAVEGTPVSSTDTSGDAADNAEPAADATDAEVPAEASAEADAPTESEPAAESAVDSPVVETVGPGAAAQP